MRSRARVPFFCVTSFVIVGALGACNGQGEGERCDTRASGTPAGTSDCQSGLTCQQVLTVNSEPNGGICCPPDRTQATTSACAMNAGSVDASTAPPTGSGDAALEAAGEAGTDATSEAAADGALEAAGEAGADATSEAAADGAPE